RVTHSRIFEKQSVPDILTKVLTGVEISKKLQGQYEPREYCVQYRESDFAFASRLMEEEGIFYYFEHTQRSHKMIVGDKRTCHTALTPTSEAIFKQAGAKEGEMVVFGWEKSQELRSIRTALWDFTFEMPDKNLEAKADALTTVSAGTVSHKL